MEILHTIENTNGSNVLLFNIDGTTFNTITWGNELEGDLKTFHNKDFLVEFQETLTDRLLKQYLLKHLTLTEDDEINAAKDTIKNYIKTKVITPPHKA